MAKNSSPKTPAIKPDRPNREDIKDLPAHAQYQWRQGTWYVYFPYCFRENGARKQERDYIGVLSDDGLQFEPNLYFLKNEPVFENRPPERWKNEMMRRRAYEKLGIKEAEQSLVPGADLDPEIDPDRQFSVGSTALAVAILYRIGMVAHVAEVLGSSVSETLTCLNLAMHAAITSDKTYLADLESEQQKFIGIGCPSSPRASEFFKNIGSTQDLSAKMARSCASDLENGEIVALDGTRLDSFSENISLAAVGKRKDGTFGPQVNLSILLNVRTGAIVSYRAYGGNVNDISTLNDLRHLWSDIGISEKEPVILMDRGYPSQKEFIDLDRDGFKFLIGARASMSVIKKIIDERNSDFYDQKYYLRNQRCYGVKDKCTVKNEGRSTIVRSYVFRSPGKEMTQTDELLNALDAFSKGWPKKYDDPSYAKSPLLKFFKNPVKGQPLEIDQDVLSYECYGLGYFGLVGNVDIPLLGALDRYRQRNEVEIAFKLMFQNLMSSTRSHSSAAFEGLLMTTIVGLSILTYLRTHMSERIPNERARDPDEGSIINSLWTIQELLKDLRRIKIAFSKSGKARLLNVVKRDKDVAAALGFPGLFDSADKVAELLSAKKLAAAIRTPKQTS